MRLLISNVITPEEANIILNTDWDIDYLEECGMYHDASPIPNNDLFSKIKEAIESEVGEIDWASPSYMTVEKTNAALNFKGMIIDWHKDEMAGAWGEAQKWCDYGCSLLLNDKETSGYLEYKDGTKILPEEHYCSLAIHSNDIEHRAYSDGTREVLLCFMQRKL